MDLLQGKNLVKADGSKVDADTVLGTKKVICFYFSAHWCPPCRAFTPVLKDFYEEVAESGVEVVFVSSDRSNQDMLDYMREFHGDWFATEHDSEASKALKQNFGISGIPALVVVKADGDVITKQGRQDVQSKGPMAVKDWL